MGRINKSMSCGYTYPVCCIGEKEEELEGVMADMKEVKLLYRQELDSLLDKIAPSIAPDDVPYLPQTRSIGHTSKANMIGISD